MICSNAIDARSPIIGSPCCRHRKKRPSKSICSAATNAQRASAKSWRWGRRPHPGPPGISDHASDAFVKRVADQGLRVREYAPPRFGSVECTVSADDHFLIGCFDRGLARGAAGGSQLVRSPGCRAAQAPGHPFHSEAGGVALQQSITYAKAAPSETMIARLIAFDEKLAERLFGEYTFNHPHN